VSYSSSMKNTWSWAYHPCPSNSDSVIPKMAVTTSALADRGSNSVKLFNRAAHLHAGDAGIKVHYVETMPRDDDAEKGTIVLIHGSPETSYQFRHAMVPLAEAGYHVIAPDKTGYGFSSKPVGAVHQHDRFTKKSFAKDLHQLLIEHLGIKDPIHVGHDIGGMVTHEFVCQFPDSVASVTWGECPLPGSTFYEKKHSSQLWHFDFQSHMPDVAVALVQGKERMYLKHFYDRVVQNQAALAPEVLDYYVQQFSAPDALRCATFRLSHISCL